MRRRALIIVTILVGIMVFPPLVEAAEKVHWFQCGDCHRAVGLKPWQLTGVCSKCHPKDPTNWSKIAAGSTIPVSTLAPGNFDINDASNALGSHPSYNSVSARDTSHYWASTTDSMPEAGALPPVNPALNNTTASKGKVTCSRCHDPHAFDSNPKMTKIDNSRDQMCKDCHRPWNKSSNSGLETHPMAGDYDAAVAAAPEKFNALYNSTTGLLATNVNQGAVRVVYNSISAKFMVSCTSCHGVHYTDSDSTTADGMANRAGLVKGDGRMLRTDGPLKTVTPYNNANSILQAQALSRLCQTCHTYQTHGKAGYEPTTDLDSVDEQVGCLVCHSGHSYNAGTPNYFVLRRTVNTASFGPDKTTLYTTNPTTWETYCTSCHGPVSGFPTVGAQGGLRNHTPGENCKTCHAHDATYSFAMGDNAVICGDCHGAPPRSDTPAIPGDLAIDTGYAVYNGSLNYRTAGQDGKDESRTPHKIHAGALNADKAAVDYAFGSTAGGLQSACLPCHNDMPDTVTKTHDTGLAGTFQNVEFNSLATANGVITGQAYPLSGGSAWKCSNVYCHSNGGRRRTDGLAKQAADYKTTQTLAWPLASNPSLLVGTATECQQCHGENIATMEIGVAATEKGNSQTHDRHLTKLNNGSNNKTTCYICHSDTVSSAGVVPAAARNIRDGGKHVNGTPDVVFNRPTALYNTLSTATYTPGTANGTCSVYCHNPSALDTSGGVVDWDNYTGAALACDACHGGLAANTKPMSTGSHSRHIASAGAYVKCDSCHGAGAALGTHSGHVDGQVTRLTDANSCDLCHGVENTAAWDVTPQWWVSTSSDCRTCHIDSVVGGNSVTSYVDTGGATRNVTSANGYDKSNYSAKGHGKTGIAKVCTECHDSAYSATHMNATQGDNRLLAFAGGTKVYGTGTDNNANIWCQDCHAGHYVHYPNTRTSGGTSFDGDRCNLCHNPHGQVGVTLGAMLAGTINGKTVADYVDGAARTDFYVPTPGTNYGICQVCHDSNEVPYFNTTQAAATTHMSPDLCTGCHVHTDNPGFQFSASGCESCHGPGKTRDVWANGAHTVHIGVGSFDLDKSECALCHLGADTYTSSLGTPASHGNAGVDVVAGLGYSLVSGKYTCTTNTCHASGSTDGFWKDTASGNAPDTALNCNACHGGANADGRPNVSNHNKHVLAGMDCAGCHTGIDLPGNALTHLTVNAASTTDALKLQDKAQAVADEAAVTESTFTENATATFNDTNNTCSNTYCHDPSSSGRLADWDTDSSTGNCALCHGYNTTMTTGSHGNHLNNASVIGDNFACTVCHPNNTLNTHFITSTSPFTTRNQVVVAGSKVNTYSAELNLPSTAYGTCTASQCHNDGKGANVASPAWGRAPQSADNCTICHAAPPANGDHGGHWVSARQTLGLGCTSCHFGTTASDTTIKAGSLHLNGESYNVVQGGNYNASAVTIGYTQATPSTCTVSCHSAPASPYSWAAASTCEGCHAAKMLEAKHARHVTVSPSIDADKSDCAKCHPNAALYTIAPGNGHRDGPPVTLAAGIIAGPDYTCATVACHASSGTDGYWTDPNGLDCAACHFYHAAPTSLLNTGHARPLSASHNKHFNKGKVCTDCHGTLPTNTAHIDNVTGANEGAKFDGKAHAVQDEATIDRPGTVFDDDGADNILGNADDNTCSGGIGLGCHASGIPDWDNAITTCTACHTNETDATFNPTTGLHNAGTATRHDDTLQTGNCTNCHAASPSALHQNGVKNDAVAGSFTWNSNVTNYSSANGCNATCHTDGGDWRRKWVGAEDAKPLNTNNPGDAVCSNCHGDPTGGWRWNEANATTVDHTDANGDLTDKVTGSHGTCQTCHGWGAAGYNRTWRGTSDAAWVGHGDGHVTMNGPSATATGSGYDNTTGGCAQSCHLDVAGRRMNYNSGWANINYGDFGKGTCDSCHGYPPAVGDGKVYQAVEGKRAHGKHVNHLATRAGVTLNASTDTYGNAGTTAVCGVCHNMAPVNHEIGGGNRAISVPSDYQFDNVNPQQYNGIQGVPSATTPKNCSSVSCHFKITPVWE